MSKNFPQEKSDPSTRSPFAGCAILITAFLVMVFLIGFSILTLFRQFNEIAKFTAGSPVSIQVPPLENQEEELNRLAVKIESFRQQLLTDAASSLSLSPEEMNLAIAAYEPLKELRGTFHISKIEKHQLFIDISFPLNGKPRLTRENEPGWITSDSRYLNATLIARPELHQKEVVLAIDSIKVPEASVPPEFIGQMSPYRIAERYLADPNLGPAMANLTRVDVADGKLILARNPGENPVGLITNKQVDSASNRLFKAFGIAAAVFLTFAAIVIFIGIRAKTPPPENS
jgi:hypothetical protein